MSININRILKYYFDNFYKVDVEDGEINICYIEGMNRDGFRTGDLVDRGTGINQHGTRPGFSGRLVDFFSEGCLVTRNWQDHLAFIQVCQTDPRYITDNNFRFSATIIPGNEL